MKNFKKIVFIKILCVVFFMIYSIQLKAHSENQYMYTNDIGTTNSKESICNELMKPVEFDVTISLGIVSVTFHIYCESEEALLVFIATSGGLGCDYAREVAPTDDSSGGGKTMHYDKESLLAGIEKALKVNSGSLEYIEVKGSSSFEANGKKYRIKSGKYKVDRDINYPLDFRFQVEEIKKYELNKKQMKKKTYQIKN